jgi:hypothetical protein
MIAERPERGRMSPIYSRGMACAICGTRRPRRFCPGVRGDICTVCCGTEREVTVACPLDCEFLVAAREFEKLVPVDPGRISSRDIRVTEELLDKNEALVAFLGHSVAAGAMATPSAVDSDVREALESLVRTYRTLENGVFYETLPPNPLASSIHRKVQEDVAQFRRYETRQTGMSKTRDADVLACLVFFERMAWQHNNGRRNGRAFLSALAGFYGGDGSPEPSSQSPLILP